MVGLDFDQLMLSQKPQDGHMMKQGKLNIHLQSLH